MPRFKGQFIRGTEKALLYWLEGRGEEWFPRSQIYRYGDDFIDVSSWIAYKKDMTDEVEDSEDPGDWDEEQMADTCHPGHPSNYGHG